MSNSAKDKYLSDMDEKVAHKGWWFCRLKNGMSKEERRRDNVADSFEDWIYFDGDKWCIQDYRELGFYVLSVIRGEGDNG